MSSSTDADTADARSTPSRQPAVRVFEDELAASTFAFSEEDRETAPQYLLLPTGRRVNRVLMSGVFTDVSQSQETDGSNSLRARFAGDKNGLNAYPNQYTGGTQILEPFHKETPQIALIVAKPKVSEREEGKDQVYLNVEWAQSVSPKRRARWVARTATQTVERIDKAMAANQREEMSDMYIELANEEYDPDLTEYRDSCLDHLQAHGLID
jgi:RPA family protein